MAAVSIKKRHTIRKSQISQLFLKLEEQIGESAQRFVSDRVERLETDTQFTIYLIDRKPLLLEYESWVFPTLRGAVARPFPERNVTVDSGAVPFMAKGADVMRPGIISVTGDVRAGLPVVIVDERHVKPLAVAIALMDASEMRTNEKGKAARTIHHVGDPLWNLDI